MRGVVDAAVEVVVWVEMEVCELCEGSNEGVVG